jgi:hypothetical protein
MATEEYGDMLEAPIRQIVVYAGVEGTVIVPSPRCRTRRRSPA